MTRFLVAVAAAIALVSCQSAESVARPTAKGPQPALWKLSDSDTTIYLFGTIHLLPAGLEWKTPRIRQAIASSQALVLETVIAKDPKVTGATIARIGVSPGLPPLLDRVPPEKRAGLEKAIARAGATPASLDRLETWAAALMLASASFQSLNVSPANGAEPVLTAAFEAQRKPVSGLETPEQQLGFFDSLPESAQRKFLASVVEDEATMQKEFDAMIGAWTAGDVKRIALTFDEELKLTPELAETLLRQRNRNWAAWIAERMNQPGTVFVAVGAGHLAGSDSVESLLEQRGFRVQRVQ